MHDIHVGAPVRLQVRSLGLPLRGTLRLISPDWVPLDPSLGQKEQLAGINPPRFYIAEARLDNRPVLYPGMTGIAKIQVGRRSLMNLGLKFARDLLARRVW